MGMDNHEASTTPPQPNDDLNGGYTPLSPAAFAHRIGQLEKALHDLTVRLYGDEAKRKIWEQAKRGYVTPNIDEPDPGQLDLLMEAIRQINSTQDALATMTTERFRKAEEKLSFAARLESFFGPLLANKNPPMDGAQIVARSELDDALARLANALRDEWSEARHFVEQLERKFRDFLPKDLVATGPNLDPRNKKLTRLARLEYIGELLLNSWAWSEQAKRAAHRPGRLQLVKTALRTIVTGKESDQP